MKWLTNIFQKAFWGKFPESAKIDCEVVDLIAPGLYQFLVERKIPAAKITLENPWDKKVQDFEAQLRLQDITDWVSSSLSEVKPKDKGTIRIVLPLPLDKLYGYEEKTASFELKCHYRDPSGKSREYSDTKIVRILAKDDMIWSLNVMGVEEDLSELIAAWVTPRDDNVQKLIHESAKNEDAKAVGGLLGYQETQYISHLKERYRISPNTHMLIKLHLRENSVVQGVLSQVLGGSGNDIRFGLLDPDKMIALTSNLPQQAPVLLQLAKSGYQIRFNAPIESDYYMVFDNTFSTFAKKEVEISIQTIASLTHSEIVWYQLRAIYETIQQKGYSYVSSPISYAPGVSQRVKRPVKTIELKGGNCIDGCVLFASCFEAIGLDTHIIILPNAGHSLVATRTWRDSPEFWIIEATAVGSSSFEESLRTGNDAYERNRETARWISITDARKKRVMPLA